MNLLDLSIIFVKGNWYVLVMVCDGMCYVLFLSMDGGMSIAGQDRGVCGGCFLQQHCMPFWDA